jgi:putative hydrolase of the HAD superfamily
MLQRLKKQGKKIGIITDGRPEGQRAKIAALQLKVDECIITDELGGIEYRKPNELAFRLMQERMQVPYEKMVYIGDNIKKDFIAPKRLGMKCIYVRLKDGLYYESITD